MLLKLLDQQSESSNLKLVNKTMDVLVEADARKGGGILWEEPIVIEKQYFLQVEI